MSGDGFYPAKNMPRFACRPRRFLLLCRPSAAVADSPRFAVIIMIFSFLYPGFRRSCHPRGFTLIELCAVLAILAILATVALVAYRHVGVDRYDPEATASLTDLYEQAFATISDWGIGSDKIKPGCVLLGPASAGLSGQTGAGLLPNDLKLQLRGAQHWQYRICLGFDDNQSETIVVDAHRESGGSQRVIVAGSGFDSPVVACSSLDAAACAAFRLPVKIKSVPWTPLITMVKE